MTTKIAIELLVPGGILPTDYVHHVTNDSTCSRCRKPIGDDEVPLMLWQNSGNDMLIFCVECLRPQRLKDSPGGLCPTNGSKP